MNAEKQLLDERLALIQRLREARKTRGFTQEEAARSVNMSRTTLVAIEKGDRAVRPAELIDLAALYGRSINELLRPSPVSSDLVAQFRASPGRMLDEMEVDASIGDLQELADDYLHLEQLAGASLPQRYPSQAQISGVAPGEAAENLAATERNRLGLGDGPVLELRKLLEADVGIRVFALDLPSRVAGLFASSDVHGACIALNAGHPFERQRWSLAHEYAHFLAHRDRSEVTLMGGYGRIPSAERFADAFAENFLMPPAGLKRRFHEINQSRSGAVTPADFLYLADLFQVSFDAMVRRLENLELVRRHTREKLMNSGFKVGEARQLLGLDSRSPDTGVLPHRFRYLAFEVWRDGELTEGQLARLLRLDRTTTRQLVSELSRHLDSEENQHPNTTGEGENEVPTGVTEVEAKQRPDLIQA